MKLTSAAEGEKSVGQQASDTVSGTGTGSGEQGQGVLANAQEMAGNAAKSVQDTLGMGRKYLSQPFAWSGHMLMHATEK